MKLNFNNWSWRKIDCGMKKCTSRKKQYDDPRVEWITPRLPWGFIKRYFYRLEGANSEEELQIVIEDIHGREIKDNELFYVHFGNFQDT